MALAFPDISVPVVDPQTGLMTQTWYDYLKFHQKLSQLPDISPVAPLNGQTIIWNDTTKLWVPGAN